MTIATESDRSNLNKGTIDKQNESKENSKNKAIEMKIVEMSDPASSAETSFEANILQNTDQTNIRSKALLKIGKGIFCCINATF